MPMTDDPAAGTSVYHRGAGQVAGSQLIAKPFDGHTMLNANNDERQVIVDYLATQAPDERVDLLQKVYTERLHDITYDIWDVHTEKERW